MESVEQSSLNTSDKPNVWHLQTCQENYNNNGKMISTTTSSLLKQDVPIPTEQVVAQMDKNQHQHQQHHHHHYQQQQRMLNINKCTQILNKNNTISSADNNNQQQQQQHTAVSSNNSNSINTNNSCTTINSPKMGSRRIFTPQFKLQVLESYRNDNDCKGNQRATARKYNIHRRQIQKWLQCESNLRSSVANINQSQVKHEFHNVTPTTAATTTAHNSQFVSQTHHYHQQQVKQQQQQQHQYQQQKQQNLNSSLCVPSASTIALAAAAAAANATTTTNATPSTSSTGVLASANFSAVVAAAVSIANIDKSNTHTTRTLSTLRPTAIVGGTDKIGDNNSTTLLHPHAQLTHMPHYNATNHHLHSHAHHHHHHHHHGHGHHHHPYSSLPYTHTTLPILTHQQPLYPHSATAVLLAAAHHHLTPPLALAPPPPPPPPAPHTLATTLHHHHYQQRQHKYQTMQQQQQQQQSQQQATSSACLLFAAAAATTNSITEREPLDMEVIRSACTESAGEIQTEYQGNNCQLATIQSTTNYFTGNSNNCKRETEIENGSGRISMTAVYKCYEKDRLQQLKQQQPPNKSSTYLLKAKSNDDDEEEEEEKSDIEQAPIKPIDLSLTGAKRNHKLMCKKDATMIYNKHFINIHDDDYNHVNQDANVTENVVGAVSMNIDNQNTSNSEKSLMNEKNEFIVDLTFTKRKVTTTMPSSPVITAETSSNTTDAADHDVRPEKIPKLAKTLFVSANEIKEELLNTHDVNVKCNTFNNNNNVQSSGNTSAAIKSTVAAQNAIVKPVKLFKPYLLHEEKECEDHGELQSAANSSVCQEQVPLTQLPLSIRNFGHQYATTPETLNAGTFQGVNDNKNTFPVENSYFPGSSSKSSKPASPKSALCSPTTSTPALSPTRFQYSKGSPVSGYESSSSTCSDCSSYHGLSHYSIELQWRAIYGEQMNSPPHTLSYGHTLKQTVLPMQQEHQQQQRVQRWLDQDTQCCMTTNSSGSSPALSHTPSPTTTPAVATTPPAVNTTIALYA